MSEQAVVLVVDDEHSIRDMLSSALQAVAYDVISCEDAEQALEMVQHKPADVAVVDVLLPGADGLQLCRQLQDKDGTEVILITGNDRRYSYADAAASGASDFILKPIKINELLLRVDKALAVRRTRASRDRLMDELRRLVITDGLTGLFNSRHFFERLEVELSRTVRYGRSLALLMLDVDRFKAFNDRFGHQEGDRALRAVADALTTGIRASDSAFRYGGEEFAVLLPETAADGAMLVARRLVEAVATRRFGPEGAAEAELTVSVGVAARRDGETSKDLLRRADEALYASKNAGRNRATLSDA